ncbi:MAG: hypothetical protein KF832_07990 [Caldilineaceae bacterium]|nr:hypothetical protein [Caldilineaceae bacterium]
MFAYNLPDGLPAGSRTVWSPLPLQPLAACLLTPFSYSILDEVAKSAWFHYFDALGFNPMPRARVLRQHQGYAYFNLTISAQRDAEIAAVEPMKLQLNGQPFALAPWEKPSFLAGMKASLKRGKIEQQLKQYQQQIATIRQNAEAWYHRTQELRWTQADILQIMEEIERISIPSFAVLLAAQHNALLIYNQLLWATQAQQPFPRNGELIQQALGDDPTLVEEQIAEQIQTLRKVAQQDAATVAWLQAGQTAEWQTTLPNPALVAALAAFLRQYGHRCVNEGEVSYPRWQQDPSPLFAALLVREQAPSTTPAQVEPLLAAVDSGQRASVQQQLAQLRQLRQLQSQAQHAFAYILAGTRRWALAAAKEALSDQRLQHLDEVFFYQLEEVKQMMTGEWNISTRAEIQSTRQHRQRAMTQWQQATAVPLLIGDAVATPTQPWHTSLAPTLAAALGKS